MKVLESSIIVPIIFTIILITLIAIVTWSAQLQEQLQDEMIRLSQDNINRQVTLIRVTDLLIDATSTWIPKK
jgi:hypothetical protein